MLDRTLPDDEPCYVISIAAKLVSLHPQTLRYYDRIGLITPRRTGGRIRLYSPRDIERLRKIARLTEDLGVNLAGVDVIMRMAKSIEQLQAQLERQSAESEAEIRALKQRIKEIEDERGKAQQSYQVINVSARELTGTEEDES